MESLEVLLEAIVKPMNSRIAPTGRTADELVHEIIAEGDAPKASLKVI